MMTSQRVALSELDVGDLLHAEHPDGPKLIAITLDVTATRIRARDICRQEVMEFDRQTGLSVSADAAVPWVIYSTEPMPPELYEALIGLDRKYGSGRVPTDEESKLTPAEKKALIFINP
ncbi:MAG: hypothetical protein HYZ40_12760 [Rhodospirillales bacterium]|nr:hypothetical protein [Rhodospirillales bacterium]